MCLVKWKSTKEETFLVTMSLLEINGALRIPYVCFYFYFLLAYLWLL